MPRTEEVGVVDEDDRHLTQATDVDVDLHGPLAVADVDLADVRQVHEASPFDVLVVRKEDPQVRAELNQRLRQEL